MKKIVFLSNGFGEDIIGKAIVSALLCISDGTVPLAILPLVGLGVVYQELPVEILDPRALLPSGGMLPENPSHIVNDMKAGLISLVLRQFKTLNKIRSQTLMGVAVGDMMPVLFSAWGLKRPTFFVGTAKSNYFTPYSKVERLLMKTLCRKVFVRDQQTSDDLSREGINSNWPGNVMMDALEYQDLNWKIPPEDEVIALIPGSRTGALENFATMLETAELLEKALPSPIHFPLALAQALNPDPFIEAARLKGWESAVYPSDPHLLAELKKNNMIIYLLKNCFGNILQKSRLVLGQGGTANEQAVGMGKPVVAFALQGEQSWYRKRQKGLLGDSLIVVEPSPEAITEQIVKLKHNRELYDNMAAIGKERMGPPGGANKIAREILDYYRQFN